MTTKEFRMKKSSSVLLTEEEYDNHQGAQATNCRQQVFAEEFPLLSALETLAHRPHSQKVSWRLDV